ncbi:MAG: GAF domain-containing sensor histidine kinase [Polyangiaceae bacterium]|nr:GAF domain-containing sensor histidine kinase [Polyangiaceae bacterium]
MSSVSEPGRSLEQRQVALEAALARERRVSRALREVGSALGTTLDLDDLLELILGRLTELVEADRATLYLLDEVGGELVSRVIVGQKVRSIRIKVGRGIAGVVAQTGAPIRVRDAYEDPRFEREWDALTGYRTTSMLAAPLKNHLGRTIGVLQVLNKQTAAEFGEEDEAMVTALCTQAAVAIDNSRLFMSLIQKNKELLDTKEQLERRLRDLVFLFDLERAMARAVTIDALAAAALGLATTTCEARAAAMLLVTEETGQLVEYVYDPSRPEQVERIGVREGEGLLAAALGEPEALEVTDPQRHPSFSPRVEGAFPFPVDSALLIELEGDRAPLGAIGLFSKMGPRRFDQDDRSLLRLIAANVSTAVRLQRASEARERSERLMTIGRLLSQVIHDFKTPMTVISGYVQLMQDADDRERRTAYAEEVLRQFDVLTSMQREVLEFARGERTIFVRRTYLKKFFADVRHTLELELVGKPIELVMDIDAKAVGRFDEQRMARALQNLSRNAIEAMTDGGGRLTVRAGREGDEIVMSVSDTGRGIPKEIEGRLFQSFVSAGKKGGTGLGLAIVKKIVDEHGGTVTVHSSSRGATFEIRLPQPSVEEVRRGESPSSRALGMPSTTPPSAEPTPAVSTGKSGLPLAEAAVRGAAEGEGSGRPAAGRGRPGPNRASTRGPSVKSST